MGCRSITAPRDVSNKTSGDINPTAMQQRWKCSAPTATLNRRECWSAPTVWTPTIAAQNVREVTGRDTRLEIWRNYLRSKRITVAFDLLITRGKSLLLTCLICQWVKGKSIPIHWLCCFAESVIQGMFYLRLLRCLMFILNMWVSFWMTSVLVRWQEQFCFYTYYTKVFWIVRCLFFNRSTCMRTCLTVSLSAIKQCHFQIMRLTWQSLTFTHSWQPVKVPLSNLHFLLIHSPHFIWISVVYQNTYQNFFLHCTGLSPLLLFLKRGYIGLILIYSIFQAIILSLVTDNIKRVAGLV